MSEEKTVCRYDTSTKETTELYVSTESIPYYIPFADLGVMIGTQAPTDAQGNAHTALTYKENLTWGGEYYYYKTEGEAPILVEDPDWFLFAAASNFTSLPNFKTTINGKAIPHSKYAHGSTYNNNDFSGATQCEGFAKYIYQYLFGSAYSGTKTDVKERITGATYVKNKLSNLPLGSIIRTDKTGAYQSNTGHAMVLVGKDSSGITIYHANWDGANGVMIHYLTWSQFANTFNYLYYLRCPNHAYGAWKSISSTTHQRTCTICGATQNGSHYAKTTGMGTCLGCGYYGNILVGTQGLPDEPELLCCSPISSLPPEDYLKHRG